MTISGVNLMPQMNATNSGAEGAQIINEAASFQEELKAATDKLNLSLIHI